MDENKEKTEVSQTTAPTLAQPQAQVDFSDIFVTEKDTFDVTVKYYRKDSGLMVEEVDEEFDPKQPCKEFNMTFKYPDQGDSAKIIGQATKLNVNVDTMDVRDLLNLEFARMVCLIRKWDLGKELSNKSILSMHPKVIKAVIVHLRNKLGMDGIL